MTRRKSGASTPSPEDQQPEEQQPQHGGSFVRQPDGKLEVVEQTKLVADDDDGADDQEGAAEGDEIPPTDPVTPGTPPGAPTEEA
ncbi:hypothetical protein [Sphingomonas sp. 28-63-12]|uniref:hypothetical protein n=1 Tax=Sphingomonas sp. 28-63-12 TaxID=1970434 RepID=UPI000BD8EA71|nr:MAG: hypothetical protein B7Y47_16625 [Sphingomonas sp. 28-63-12]